MTPERWRQIEELYHAARERSPADRAALLAQADPELRLEVETMLAQDASGKILDRRAEDLLTDSSSRIVAAGSQLGPLQIEALRPAAVLADSVIMIDHFKGIPAATKYISETHGKLAISVITRAEVLTGFEGKERQVARRLLDRFPTLIFDRPVTDLAATLRRRNRWRMPDALQAALAKHHQLKLATRDTDDFSPKR